MLIPQRCFVTANHRPYTRTLAGWRPPSMETSMIRFTLEVNLTADQLARLYKTVLLIVVWLFT